MCFSESGFAINGLVEIDLRVGFTSADGHFVESVAMCFAHIITAHVYYIMADALRLCILCTKLMKQRTGMNVFTAASCSSDVTPFENVIRQHKRQALN